MFLIGLYKALSDKMIGDSLGKNLLVKEYHDANETDELVGRTNRSANDIKADFLGRGNFKKLH